MGLAEKGSCVYSSNVKTKTRKHAAHSRKPAAAPARASRQTGPRDKDLEIIQKEITAVPATQHLEDWVHVPCPYCGETLDVHVTSEQDGQTLYEDCSVCCRPVSLLIQVEDEELQVEAQRS